MNLEAVIFVYRLRRKPYTVKCCYLPEAHTMQADKRWRHTLTLDPALWIAHLVNHPLRRKHQIEELEK